MSIQGQIVISVFSLLLLWYVVAMTVRERLSETWCLLWAAVLIAGTILVNWPSLLARATTLVGAVYPASALTMVALVFLLLLAIHASSEATIHSRQIIALAREIALLRHAIEERMASAVKRDNDGVQQSPPDME